MPGIRRGCDVHARHEEEDNQESTTKPLCVGAYVLRTGLWYREAAGSSQAMSIMYELLILLEISHIRKLLRFASETANNSSLILIKLNYDHCRMIFRKECFSDLYHDRTVWRMYVPDGCR